MAGEPANRRSALKKAAEDVDPRVLDLAHLARYTMGDRSLEFELLGLFRAQVQQQVDAIATAADEESWKLATHTLKGVARTLGAWEIASTAARLEAIGFSGQPEEREWLLADLRRQIAVCEAVIARLR